LVDSRFVGNAWVRIVLLRGHLDLNGCALLVLDGCDSFFNVELVEVFGAKVVVVGPLTLVLERLFDKFRLVEVIGLQIHELLDSLHGVVHFFVLVFRAHSVE